MARLTSRSLTRILVGAADAGPATYLGYLNKLPYFQITYVATTSASIVFKGLGFVVQDLRDLTFDFDLVVTGTCVADGLDKDLLLHAKKAGIPCVCIIETWANLKERFMLNGLLSLPDYILLNDQLALKLAIEAGLPEHTLRVVGNPVLEERLSSCNEAEPEIEALLAGFDRDAVCFVSESFAEDSHLPGYERLFFDEYDVASDLLDATVAGRKFAIKLHPDDSDGKFDFLSDGRAFTYLHRIHPRSLSKFAGRIVGMESMYLLELACYRPDIISYRPGANDRWIGEQMGIVVTVKSRKELCHVLNARIVAENSMPSFEGSLGRLGSQLLELSALRRGF